MNFIPKFQQGGWSQFFAGATYPSQQQSQQTTASPQQSTQKKDNQEFTVKDVFTLLKDIKGLPNDMALLTTQLQNMYALYERTGDVNMLARMYLRNLYQLKVNVFNENEYNSAKQLATANGALEEYAITSSGRLVVQLEDGSIQEVTPEEYLKLDQRCLVLTNNDLLNLRAQSPNLINDNSILNIVNNGIGMEKVSELILKNFQELGTDELQRNGPTWVRNGRVYGAYDIVRETIKALNGNEYSADRNLQEEGVYGTEVLTKTQLNQFNQALDWIWNSLPKNARTFLLARAAVEKMDPSKLLINLIGSTLDSTSTVKFTYNEDDESTGGSRSSGSSGKGLTYNTPAEWVKGYGAIGTIRINPGDVDSYYVRANSLAVTDENDNITGGDYITVHDLYNTSFSNVLQISNATVCGKRLGSINSNAVYIANNRIYNVDFPVDLNNPDIPNLSDSYRSRAAALSSWASQQGINLNKQAERAQYVDLINKKARDISLSDQLLNPDGSYKENWRNFGVMEVIFEEGAIDLTNITNGLYTELSDTEVDNFITAMSRKEGYKNYKPNGKLYKATVWIPVDNYVLAAQLSTGKGLNSSDAVDLSTHDYGANRVSTSVNINSNSPNK